MEENKKDNLKGMVKKAEEMVKNKATETILVPLGQKLTIFAVPFTVAKVKGKRLILQAGVGYTLEYDNKSTRKRLSYKPPPETKVEDDGK